MTIRRLLEQTIQKHNLSNWLCEYPWLISELGDPHSPIWFIGENPSLKGVKSIDKKIAEKTENLQWNSHAGDRLFREAVAAAGLKAGDPGVNEGWKCFVTNAIKLPEKVVERNKLKSDSRYWKKQAEIWWPVLQTQMNGGSPRMLVCFGNQVEMIVKYMVKLGLAIPDCTKITKIHHYSYIMFRPESGPARRPPRNLQRIAEFKSSIQQIADAYRS